MQKFLTFYGNGVDSSSKPMKELLQRIDDLSNFAYNWATKTHVLTTLFCSNSKFQNENKVINTEKVSHLEMQLSNKVLKEHSSHLKCWSVTGCSMK